MALSPGRIDRGFGEDLLALVELDEPTQKQRGGYERDGASEQPAPVVVEAVHPGSVNDDL